MYILYIVGFSVAHSTINHDDTYTPAREKSFADFVLFSKWQS